MKTIRLSTIGLTGSPSRAGVTLTEVLMSVMIMTIGVVSVATLFPLSTLRVLEASRQTNSTITRFSAEALIDVDASFVHNPDGIFPPGGADQTPYNSQAFRGQVYFVDPYGWQTFHQDAGLPAAFPYIPLRDYLGQLPVGSPVNVALPRRYTGASLFATQPGTIQPYPTTTTESVNAIARAIQLVGQPDNWKLVAEGLVDTSVSATTNILSLTLENDVDLSSVQVSTSAYPAVLYRAVIFDSLGDKGGGHSEIRYLSNASASPATVSWTTVLPTLFENGNIGKVRVEQLDEVYTWALSVRKRPSGPANVDVVVYFKRSFNPQHEYVYPAPFRQYSLGPDGQPGVAGVDDNNNGTTDEIAEIYYKSGVGNDDQPNTVVTVDFTTLPAGTDPPAFRRGGWVCDTQNGLWYRITAIQNETGSSVDLVLDRFIQRNSTEDLNGNGTLDVAKGEDINNDGVLQQGGLYWNPTVVNVFPLEIKEP